MYWLIKAFCRPQTNALPTTTILRAPRSFDYTRVLVAIKIGPRNGTIA